MQTNQQDMLKIGRDQVIATATEVYGRDSNMQDLVLWFHRYCLGARLGFRQRTLLTDLHPDVAQRVWLGKASSQDLTEYCQKVGALRDQVGASNKGLFADTSYIRKIHGTAHLIKRLSEKGVGRIGYIDGDAGCGKTTGLEALPLMDLTGRYFYLRCIPVGGVQAFIFMIGHVIGLNVRNNNNTMIMKVLKGFRPGDVLILDEIHQLVGDRDDDFQRKIEFCRALADRGIGLIYASTDKEFYKRLERTAYNARQLRRREIRKLELDPKSDEFANDVDVLFRFKCPQLQMSKGMLSTFTMLHDEPQGGFGAIALVIEDAQFTADEEERLVTIEDIATSAKAHLLAMNRKKYEPLLEAK